MFGPVCALVRGCGAELLVPSLGLYDRRSSSCGRGVSWRSTTVPATRSRRHSPRTVELACAAQVKKLRNINGGERSLISSLPVRDWPGAQPGERRKSRAFPTGSRGHFAS